MALKLMGYWHQMLQIDTCWWRPVTVECQRFAKVDQIAIAIGSAVAIFCRTSL